MTDVMRDDELDGPHVPTPVEQGASRMTERLRSFGFSVAEATEGLRRFSSLGIDLRDLGEPREAEHAKKRET